MPSRLISILLLTLFEVRARTVIPLQTAWQKMQISLASGTKRTERLADFAWRRGEGLAAMRHWEDLEKAQPANARWPMRIAQARKERGDLAGAERVLLDARGRGIKNDGVELGILRYGRLCRLSNAAIEDAQTIVADPAASSGRVFF
jgi:hypothetical protein